MRHAENTRVGVFGIGLAAYWPQFPGLKERLEGYQRKVEERIGEYASVVSAGLVDDAQKAHAAGLAFRGADVRSGLLLCGNLRHIFASPAGHPGSQSAGGGVEPATWSGARLCSHGHRRVAGQLLRLLRSGDLLRVRPLGYSLSASHRHARTRTGCARTFRGRMGGDRGMVRGGQSGSQSAPGAHRLSGPSVSGNARHVQRLHPASGATRNAHRGAGDVRPRIARERRHGGRSRAQGCGGSRHFRDQ